MNIVDLFMAILMVSLKFLRDNFYSSYCSYSLHLSHVNDAVVAVIRRDAVVAITRRQFNCRIIISVFEQ
jgi:hypothetical protein